MEDSYNCEKGEAADKDGIFKDNIRHTFMHTVRVHRDVTFGESDRQPYGGEKSETNVREKNWEEW